MISSGGKCKGRRRAGASESPKHFWTGFVEAIAAEATNINFGLHRKFDPYIGAEAMALHAPCVHLRSSFLVSSSQRNLVQFRLCEMLRPNTCCLQVGRSSSSVFSKGQPFLPSAQLSLKRKATFAAPIVAAAATAAESTDRFRLNNLSPQKGSRRPEKRKGRGYGAGQVSVLSVCKALTALKLVNSLQ